MLISWIAKKFEMKRNRTIVGLGILVFMLIMWGAIFNRQTIAAFVVDIAVQMHLMEKNGPAMVQIPGKDYKIGKYEVTQKEWCDIMGNNPSHFSSCGDTCPVEQVSWNDVQKFIQKLNAKSGRHYRLPTETEWEFACYGGTRTRVEGDPDHYCGGDNIDSVAWYGKTYVQPGNSGEKTHPAGQKQANGYGLHDMSGNVAEWASDCYGDDCTFRVLRGGSWDLDFLAARAGKRSEGHRTVRLSDIGFRLAESNDPSLDVVVASGVSDTDEESSASDTVVASSPSTYYVEDIAEGEIDEEDNRHRLVANIHDEELKGPAAPIMFIEKEADFNGDGVMDALVTTSGGGNCCPDTYMIASVHEGKVVTTELVFEGGQDWGQTSVIEENGRLLVKHETDDATTFYAYGKDFDVKVRTVPHVVLKTEKEIHGEGNLYTGTDLERTLKADLNKDGKKEEITCTIWTRWGLLTNCSLPLPDGSSQTSEVQCYRFGVLRTSRNGYRELVCDNNKVIYFDGEKWVTDEK